LKYKTKNPESMNTELTKMGEIHLNFDNPFTISSGKNTMTGSVPNQKQNRTNPPFHALCVKSEAKTIPYKKPQGRKAVANPTTTDLTQKKDLDIFFKGDINKNKSLLQT
jgi:hypothetical protein